MKIKFLVFICSFLATGTVICTEANNVEKENVSNRHFTTTESKENLVVKKNFPSKQKPNKNTVLIKTFFGKIPLSEIDQAILGMSSVELSKGNVDKAATYLILAGAYGDADSQDYLNQIDSTYLSFIRKNKRDLGSETAIEFYTKFKPKVIQKLKE